MFVAMAKICQRKQLSYLFQSAGESEQIHQALEIKGDGLHDYGKVTRKKCE